MTEDAPKRSNLTLSPEASRLLDTMALLSERFYRQAQAGRWGLTPERFSAALERSSKKALTAETLTPQKLESYLAGLHLEDLALASACAEGVETAWEYFFSTYRTYLRSAAAVILHCPSTSADACDLADSLFSELYGLPAGKGSGGSLFRYFHGRSSLKTWLRAILAQRHIDSIRAARRFEDLPEDDSQGAISTAPLGPPIQPADPHREGLIHSFTRALQAALDLLEPREKERLRLYYAEEKTLAEIGRQLGEHESSVSRHLDRVRRELRQNVENMLRAGVIAANGFAAQPALSDAEIALCFEYSGQDTPLDLDQLLPQSKPRGPAAGKLTP